MPIIAYVGKNPMRVVEAPMRAMVMKRTFLRPILSPMRPK